MAVLMMAEMRGMTPEIYDALNEAMNFPAETPDGLLSHTAAPTENGMQIVDVWESREHNERFLQEKLGPAFAQVDGTDAIPPPSPTELEVHNRFAG
jgi:uncharacterized protein YeaC (DUF1315 family)